MITDITPRTVKVQQGYEVTLEKKGFTRDFPKYTVTMFYGRRPNGKMIYSVPVFTNCYGQAEVIGEAVSTGYKEV
jgi:hypothetical protein